MKDIPIAFNLKFLRQSSNMTQSELAERLHVTTASVSKYELGTVVPDIEKLKLYSIIFNVSIDYIVGLSNSLNDTVKPIEYTQEETELLELFKQLPEKYKYEIKGYIKGLISSNK